jgi:RHS repeat-associated protein
MGFYAKDEPAQPTDGRSVAGTLSRARKPRSQNAMPPILTVGIGHRFYNPGLGRWMSGDLIVELGGVHAYLFIGTDLLNQTDYLGLLSIGDIISLIPRIGTIYNAIVDPKGSDVGDYTINISKETCCELTDAVAEFQCTQSIAVQVASYELQYNGLLAGHALLDVVAGLLARHPIAYLIVGADAILDMLITFSKIDKIGDAGAEAAKKCDCRLYK